MSKFVKPIILCSVIGLVIVISYIAINGKIFFLDFGIDEAPSKALELKDTYHADIMYLGEDITFDSEFSYRLVDSLSEQSLSSSNSHGYRAVIV